jgi:hypothetical protein
MTETTRIEGDSRCGHKRERLLFGLREGGEILALAMQKARSKAIVLPANSANPFAEDVSAFEASSTDRHQEKRELRTLVPLAAEVELYSEPFKSPY